MKTWWWVLAVMGCGAPHVGGEGESPVVDGVEEVAGEDVPLDTGDPSDGASSELGNELFAWCERWIACGGTWYETPQDCVDATYAYWGECEAVTAALDEFAACMLDVPCSDFDADTFDPAESSCSSVWEGVVAVACAD